MSVLEQEIAFFEANEATFLEHHDREWVVISGETVIGFFDNFQKAAKAHTEAFSGNPILIRQVGDTSVPFARVEFAFGA